MTQLELLPRPDLSVDSVRSALPCKREPYWHFLEHCRHVGYQKREGKPAYWMARLRTKAKRYRERRLGPADIPEFPFTRAVIAAREWFAQPENQAIAAHPYPVGTCQDLKICPIGNVYTVGHALHDYVEWKRLAATHNTFTISLNLINCHIVPRLAEIPLQDFTGIHYREFAKLVLETPPKRGNRPIGPRRPVSQLRGEELRRRKSSLNVLVSMLRGAFRLAWENGYIESERSWRCLRRLPNVERPRLLHLSRQECQALLKNCRDDLRHLVLGALYTGCRSIELINLTVEDLGKDGYGVYVAPFKNYKARFVFLPDEAMAYLLRCCADKDPRAPLFARRDGRPWPYRQYRNIFRSAVSAAGLPSAFTFHGLRHTYASQLVQAGMPLSAIAEQLGHADTNTVSKTYGHLAPQIRESEVRYRFADLDSANVDLALSDAGSLEALRKCLHGPDWRGYAQIPDVGSWPRANLNRGDPELVALCRKQERPFDQTLI